MSRAVRVGNIISISGTAPITGNGSTGFIGDVYNQTKLCLQIIRTAIESAGGKISDTMRTRILLKNIEDWKEAGRAHGEVFSVIKPACTFMSISNFIDPNWLVEIEADIVVDSNKS
jgi:enamine deaminase RidA (YjgF/YER057c/UK114 family)